MHKRRYIRRSGRIIGCQRGLILVHKDNSIAWNRARSYRCNVMQLNNPTRIITLSLVQQTQVFWLYGYQDAIDGMERLCSGNAYGCIVFSWTFIRPRPFESDDFDGNGNECFRNSLSPAVFVDQRAVSEYVYMLSFVLRIVFHLYIHRCKARGFFVLIYRSHSLAPWIRNIAPRDNEKTPYLRQGILNVISRL